MDCFSTMDWRPLDPDSLGPAFRAEGLALGRGSSGLELVLVRGRKRPVATDLRAAWNRRSGGRVAPILLVAPYDGDAKVAICGPEAQGESGRLPVYPDLPCDEVERICRAALACPDRLEALKLIHEELPEAGERVLGLFNQGLLATHTLERLSENRADWQDALERARPLQRRRKQALLRGLGYEMRSLSGPVTKLVAGGSDLALGLLLNKGEVVDLPARRFSNMSPVAYALARADREKLPYVIVASDTTIRLYPVRTGVGVGQRGRAETFVQLRLDLLGAAEAGYLWLLFSPEALTPDGSLDQILADSRQYATDLGGRLRERIYQDVIPNLAEAIARARGIDRPTREQLDDTYQMALTILFRLLFIAYAEDKGLLPYRDNEDYRSRSLNQRARTLLDMARKRTPFEARPFMWNEVLNLFDAIDQGHRVWGIPAYNGGLFESQPDKSRLGDEIRQIAIDDEQFGPILGKLLLDYAERDDVQGPVDFRSLSVREFGTIYEGLLQSELSVAQTDLGVDRNGLYLPKKRERDVVVREGEIYLHNASGRRKSTGSYYTKSFAVEHLLDHALEPALDDHLARLEQLGERATSDHFFDFRVADIAMGSGHFLVAAIDRIERRFSTFLVDHPLTDVTNELARLRKRAQEAMEKCGARLDVEDTQLLRRQIARRCIYGVDLNPMAVDLARLSVWVHTFVPGLPLSLLDYNLVVGNSLVGIATLEEAADVLAEGPALWSFRAQDLLGAAQEQLDRIGRLADADAAQIDEARAAWEAARDSLAPSEALFDILAASRIDATLQQRLNEGELVNWIGEDVRHRLPGSEPHRIARAALQAIPPFHFPTAFPQVFLRERAGFDVILGNPPWEEVTVEEDRFVTRFLPGFHSLPQEEQERVKTKLRKQRPDLVKLLAEERAKADLLRKLLVTGPYPGMGTGDPDLYKAFVWRFWSLICNGSGRMGVVLPRSVYATKGATDFRKAVFRSGEFSNLTFLLNSGGWVFDDAEHRYTIALTALRKTRPDSHTHIPINGPYSNRRDYELGTQAGSVLFPLDGVLNWTTAATIPLLPDNFAAECFLQIRKAPNLDCVDEGAWRARPYRELDATNDKKYMEMTSRPQKGWWPVYGGESFDLWEPDTGRYYAWAKPNKVLKRLQEKRLRGNRNKRSPFSEFEREWAEDETTYPAYFPRIAFRDVTNRTNSRTVVTALIPPNVVAQNKAPFFLRPRGDEREEAFLLGVLSSVPLDWYARRFVELHLTFTILNSLAVPRPARDNPLWQRTVALSGRLAAVDQRYADWAAAVGVDYGPLEPGVKDDMIFELDAVVAHLYGLNADQLKHIFATFHYKWDYHARLRAALAHFERWQARP